MMAPFRGTKSRAFALTMLLGATLGAAAAQVVTFSARVVDDAGERIAARVLLRDAAGRSHLPQVATTVNIGRDHWFVCDGSARFDLPRGRYDVEVERGPEYESYRGVVDVDGHSTREFRLRRWIDMRARGYRSGENHVHAPAAALAGLLRAEDLDFGSSLAWWNGPYFAQNTSPSPEHERMTLFDVEVENAWGAVYCIGLDRPMPVAWDPARANLAYIRAARESGALVCYQGGWSREVAVDALLGLVDVVNVGDNLFHRRKFMPRGARYSNLLNAPGLPVYPDTDEGMLALATESYYRLLNCGLRLAAGAGTAAGVKSNALGYTRAYVRVGHGAGVRDFLAAWRAGRNFITNGPMLFLTAEDCEPGDTLALSREGGRVRMRAEALSHVPLRSLAIVVNGETVAYGTTGKLETVVDIKEGSWIAAVATAEEGISDETLARYRQTNVNGGEEPSRLRFAHTSPIYVTVDGKGARVAASVEETRRMLAAFERFAHQTAGPEFKDEIIKAVEEARTRL